MHNEICSEKGNAAMTLANSKLIRKKLIFAYILHYKGYNYATSD